MTACQPVLCPLRRPHFASKVQKMSWLDPPQNIHQEVWFDVFRFSEFQCMAMFMFLAISQGRCLGMASSYIYQLRVLQEFDNFECETIVIIQFGVFAMTWTWNIMEFEQWYINAFWRICPHLKFKQLIVLIFVFFFHKISPPHSMFIYLKRSNHFFDGNAAPPWATTVTRHHGNARRKDLVCWSKNPKWWGLPSFSY